MLQLFRATAEILYSYRIEKGSKGFETTINGKPWTLYNDTTIGPGRDREELVRTTVEEPFHVRKQKDGHHNMHLNSI